MVLGSVEVQRNLVPESPERALGRWYKVGLGLGSGR